MEYPRHHSSSTESQALDPANTTTPYVHQICNAFAFTIYLTHGSDNLQNTKRKNFIRTCIETRNIESTAQTRDNNALKSQVASTN